jgi:GH24 family phage-related lysozyme (muramidase)
MTSLLQHLCVPSICLAFAASAAAQTTLPVSSLLPPQNFVATGSLPVVSGNGIQELLTFKDTEIKFSLVDLMSMLRDHRHEGWVLAAYPDPNTRHPLIGAGFTLDLPVVDHPQLDLLNPQPFLEPSSAQLWQAAGLEPARLETILAKYDHDVNTWSSKTYRRKIYRRTLTPQLTDEEATRLLRISVIQAIYNARAYCRSFDDLSGPQQMAFTQLVFQMGTNLARFNDFLNTINDPNDVRALAQLNGFVATGEQHWKNVQDTLMDSRWARQYSSRAASVIAMFDPAYSAEPSAAEQRVSGMLRPPAQPQAIPILRTASYSKHSAKGRGRKATRSRIRRKLT